MGYVVDDVKEIVYVDTKNATKKEIIKVNELVDIGYKVIHEDFGKSRAKPMPHNMGINVGNNLLI